jgi:hypothetical protein
MTYASRRYALAFSLVALAALAAAVAAKDGGGALPQVKQVAAPATVADLERDGWKPDRQAGVIQLFGGIRQPGSYALSRDQIPNLSHFVWGARPTEGADHVYVVRRAGGITFISEPYDVQAIAAAGAPTLVLESGDAVVVTRLGAFGPAAQAK